MSRELTSLDSVLEIERHVNHQKSDLRAQLQKAERNKNLRSIMLTLPLVCFILLTFAFPILEMLYRSIDNRDIPQALPKTIQALAHWDYQGLPDSEVVEAFSVELLALYETKALPKIANRMNIEVSGMRSLMMKTGRKLSRLEVLPTSIKELSRLDKRWADAKHWVVFKNLSGAITVNHYLAALDMQVNEMGEIEAQPEKRQIYVDLFFKTFWMSIYYRDLFVDGLSRGVSVSKLARQTRQLAVDCGATAFLDVTIGPYDLLDCVVAKSGGD